jgi:hypothetical protein
MAVQKKKLTKEEKLIIVKKVRQLRQAFEEGELGDTKMPEDTYPKFGNLEQKRIYYTLPMALNYQRNSYDLWESAKETFEDAQTQEAFDLQKVSGMGVDKLRNLLTKHRLALQPNRHVDIYFRISKAIVNNWGSVTKLINENNADYLSLRDVIQREFKKDFPYLSGPKIFNYWMFIMSEYGEVELKNRSFIEIAPDTHVIQASIRLGLLSREEVDNFSREEISKIWRALLKGTDIDPIDVHSPLWFWSRGGFEYRVG